ncbi:hypothetical protein [Nocardia sp. CY41]|uniref:hypothetical protein n=1 Tax=Nocardia sp. CY41 TaxID=2608686 RepID=UPI00135B9F67|nr:hypothetical protein [Nocardia sp. CY41]
MDVPAVVGRGVVVSGCPVVVVGSGFVVVVVGSGFMVVVVGSGCVVVVVGSGCADVVVVVCGSCPSVVGSRKSVGVATGHAGLGVLGGGPGAVGTCSGAATDTGTAPSSPAKAAATSSIRESFLMIASPRDRHALEVQSESGPFPPCTTRVANYSFSGPLTCGIAPRSSLRRNRLHVI